MPPMTMWVPDLDGAAPPKYVALADAIARGVEDGTLPLGSQLPPQRDLARALGVTVGTVTRGYAVARERGLLSGEVGRGTFVRGPRGEDVFAASHGDTELLNLGHNAPHCTDVTDLLAPVWSAWSRRFGEMRLGYAPPAGDVRAREAGARWLARSGLDASPDSVVVVCGAQHAMMVALSACASPGERVLTESLAYPGIKSLTRMLRLSLEGVAIDAEGVLPAAFEDAAKRGHVAALYCSPNVHNPTTAVMSVARREAIGAIADRFGVTIVEDDTYGFLLDEPPPPLASFAARVSTLAGLSKPGLPALRVGYLHLPAGADTAAVGAMMASTIMASPLTAELAADLIHGGVADQLAARRRAEARHRNALARRLLGPPAADGLRESAFLWVPLPDPWRADEFAACCRERGVAVAPAEVFAVGRGAAPHAVRISLGAVPREDDLRRGLTVVAELLTTTPPPRAASGV